MRAMVRALLATPLSLTEGPLMVNPVNDGAPAIPLFDNVDLLAAVLCELTTDPIDGPLLHQHIWNYVIGERDRGTSAGRVIMMLTELVAESVALPPSQRQALQRVVLHSAVEAYFGQQDGAVLGAADFSAQAHARAMKQPGHR
jgi:hypothetical protein